MPATSDLYIGLMSGTSLDGADGVLVDFSGGALRVVAAATESFANPFRAELLALNSPTHNELHRAAVAGNQIAAVYAKVVHALLAQAGLQASQIQAVGAHGQTVRHQPQRTSDEPAGAGYTLQLNNPALLAELTGIDVAADFRSRDVAASGQGAPLVPAFHQGVFGRKDAAVCVLNLGGISNISVLPQELGDALSPILGFDCGPGNALMDAWCEQHTGQPYDAGGAWAASGALLPELLASLLDEPYFSQPIPKSTGRDLFSLEWLAGKLAPFAAARPEDVQNTLAEFTASACVDSVKRYGKESTSLIVCGGGAFNTYLLARLQAGLPQVRVSTSDAHGLPPLQVEAAAFAWLARQLVLRQPGNLPSVTGARGLRVLGAVYPG
ncbi:MAG: anhydro-N-acetylmuramic acid kinase [Polaromonas sp.]|nr:anhydro-N-acetylmuramic acid kinase [Polaromonas sp.]